VTPRERQEWADREAARRAARAKWADGSQAITDDDLRFFSGDEIGQLINAGRIPGVGPDKRLARR
jgi:hypothetical protein